MFFKIEKANKSIIRIEIRTCFLGTLGGPFFCITAKTLPVVWDINLVDFEKPLIG